jgi:rhodanese-related sulfurtransferase
MEKQARGQPMNIERKFYASQFDRSKLSWLVLAGVLCQGCAAHKSDSAALRGPRLLEKISSGWRPVILDVRSTFEYNAGHVPGARHVSFWTSIFSRKGLPADPNEPVVVYCEHGPRAYIAAWGLKNAGFRDVHLLDGHMAGWRKDGLGIEKPER